MQFRPCIDLRHGRVTQIVGSTLRLSNNKNNSNEVTNQNQSSTGADSSASPSNSFPSVVNHAVENFVSDLPSSYFVEKYRHYNLRGGHIIMLGPDNEKAALEALHTWPQALQIGGGINLDNAQYWLHQGASHVIVTSYLFNRQGEFQWSRLKELSELVTPQKLVIDLSCRRLVNPTLNANHYRNDDGKQISADLERQTGNEIKKSDASASTSSSTSNTSSSASSQYVVVTNQWQTYTSMILNIETCKALQPFCAEFLIHGVDVEGKRQGVEQDLIVQLQEIVAQTNVTITYAGGVRDLKDIETIQVLGKQRLHVSVGSALDLFGGNLSFESLVQHFQQFQETR